MNESPKSRIPGTHFCPRVKSTRRRGWKSERERKKRESKRRLHCSLRSLQWQAAQIHVNKGGEIVISHFKPFLTREQPFLWR